jgi:hypothetical protein
MKLRIAVCSLAFLVLAGSLYAADPFAGTWKLNLAKSKQLPDDESAQRPRETVITIEERGKEFIWTSRALSGNSKASVRILRVPVQGGPFTAVEGSSFPAGQTAVLKRVDDHTMETVTMLDGKAFRTEHTVLSADGRTITNEVNGTSSNPQRAGKRIDRVEVFDKQP